MRLRKHREVELLRVGGEARRQHVDQTRPWRSRRSTVTMSSAASEHGQRLLAEFPRASASPSPSRRPAIERHEGRVEGALGKQAAEQVREAEGDEEGVGDRPGAERGGDEDVADEAEDAARRGSAADGGEIPQERHAGGRRVLYAITPAPSASAEASRSASPPAPSKAASQPAGGSPPRGAAVGDLVADEIGHVEDVDRPLAEGRDMGRGDVEVEVGDRPREVVEEARPVEAGGLDHGELVRQRIVDADLGLEA